jgi:hypothetical protein
VRHGPINAKFKEFKMIDEYDILRLCSKLSFDQRCNLVNLLIKTTITFGKQILKTTACGGKFIINDKIIKICKKCGKRGNAERNTDKENHGKANIWNGLVCPDCYRSNGRKYAYKKRLGGDINLINIAELNYKLKKKINQKLKKGA